MIPMIVEVIQRPLIIADRWAIFVLRISISAIRLPVINRPRIIPIGRWRIATVAIVDWRLRRIPIPPALGTSGKGGIAPIIGAARKNSEGQDKKKLLHD